MAAEERGAEYGRRIADLAARIDGSDAMQTQTDAALLEDALAEAVPGSDGWPSPLALPEQPSVEPFDYELLTPLLAAFVRDIAERMQCPPDFAAVAAMSVVASMVGRRCGIRPKRADDWLVIPNLWAMVVGRPGVMKSPPLQEVMSTLSAIEKAAFAAYSEASNEYRADGIVAAEQLHVNKERVRKCLRKDNRADAEAYASQVVASENAAPVCSRYVVNDPTVEKLGELLAQNPQGLLLFRDELSGFLRVFESAGHETDRAFYLECWNGTGSYTYDRIGRGTIRVAGACLSVLGSIQPGPLSDFVRNARGKGDDGLLQRFQLAVWPDIATEWRQVDRAPDFEARAKFVELVQRLDAMDHGHLDDPTTIRALRFSEDAQAIFDGWHHDLELRLRSGEERECVEAHLAKYRSLVPSIALLLHLSEYQGDLVSKEALVSAIGWAEYLESHARRIYSSATRWEDECARKVAAKIVSGDVESGFCVRDIYRHGWSGLTTTAEAAAGVRILVERDWLREETIATDGRSRTVYWINPQCQPASASR